MRARSTASLLLLTAALAAPAALAGTTHHWTWRKLPAPAQLEACAQPMRRLVEARLPILELSPPPGGVQPGPLGPELLRLNGTGDDRQEVFVWPGRPGFNACHTNGYPYDAVVTAVLIAARDCFDEGTLVIGSDVGFDEWAPGAGLYQRVMGRRAVDPIGGEEDDGSAGPFSLSRAALRFLPLAALVIFAALFTFDRLRPRRLE
jgi:hypothetical protein